MEKESTRPIGHFPLINREYISFCIVAVTC